MLRNLLGITRVRDMNPAELALELVQVDAVGHYGLSHRFTANDIRALHRLWLSSHHHHAARYRTFEATRRFQWAINAFWLVGAFVPLPLANGARMPSTADDVSAEMRKVAFGSAADLR